MQEKINENGIKKSIKKFIFWKIFVTTFLITLILLVIFFGFLGSYEEGFTESFAGILVPSVLLAFIFTFFIKWIKGCKFKSDAISQKIEQNLCPFCGKEILKEDFNKCPYCHRIIKEKISLEERENGETVGEYPEKKRQKERTYLNYAGFWIRFGAFLFDYILIFALSFILAFAFSFLGFFWTGQSETVVGFAIMIIYHTFFLSIFSATPGKLVFGLRVVDDAKKEKLTFVRALIRSLSYIVSSFLFGLGFLMIAFDKSKHQGLHDKIAKTLVLREKKRSLALIIIFSIVSVILTVAILWYAYSGTEYDYFFGNPSIETESGIIYVELQEALERQPSNFQSLFNEASFIDLKEIPIKKPTEYTKNAKEIFEEYGKAIIAIGIEDLYGDFAFGSGFLISPTGLLVTNYHVIGYAEKVIVAVINNGIDLYEVSSIIAYDSIKDIAILKIQKQDSYDASKDLPYLIMGDSDLMEIGERIFAVGNPEGFTNTISDGIISQIREFKEGIKSFQITAPISMGSSGGALFDDGSEVIGITDSVYILGQNINFAIPINYVKDLIGLGNDTSVPSSQDFSNLILCNGEYQQPCPSGYEFNCPPGGEPMCCPADSIFCNGQCWEPCPPGQEFQCPFTDDAYCEWIEL